MFFEDLELPDLVKKSLKETFAVDLQRAGYTVTGSPANLSVRRTMRNSMARRISLRRPKQWELEAMREAIENARARGAEEEAEQAPPRARTARASQQDHPLYRPARCPLQPFRARAAPEHRSGDVLPDGRVGIDDRGDEGSRQAVLHAAACLSDPALPACRYRLHPSYEHGGGGRRGDLLLQPRNRRHRCFDRARKDAGDRAGSLLRPIGGTSTRHRPPTATITGRTAAAAWRCLAAKCSRSANTSPMSRSATAWEAA